MTHKKLIEEIGWNLENSYAQLPEILFTAQNPTPVHSPKLIILNEQIAKVLGFNKELLRSEEGVAVLAGNQVPEGALPLAEAYAGHQFGYFNKLGDGRAVLIGEQITPLGERVDIQLKGAGKTPYSRSGDGRAGLGPMLREYIISEAMYALGISTTRSLAVVTTGESIRRETEQPGAILTRVASSHIRVGTFEYVARFGEKSELKALADYTLQRHFKEVDTQENPYIFLLREVIKCQAELIAKWQLIGFIHGVMNTDNMTISGETIDYGPCAFMDVYDTKTVFSSIDVNGRYAYGNQPNIAIWNLARFAETLLPLIDDNQEEAIKLAQGELAKFKKEYEYNWLSGMRAKLGIFNEEAEDTAIVEELLDVMYKYEADYTNTFIALTFDKLGNHSMFSSTEFTKWYELWQSRLDRQPESKGLSHQLMERSNPAIIPRNHRVEEALEAAVSEGDYSVMERLLEVISNPYEHSTEQAYYAIPPERSDCSYKTYCGT